MNNITSQIVLIMLANVLFGCSSKNVVSTVATTRFEEQYVKGNVTKLQDSLSGTSLKDSILIVQSSPTPFSPTTDISFHVAQDDTVMISFFDLNDKFICEALHSYLLSGNYRFSSTDLHIDTGVYWMKCQIGNKSARTKIMVMR